MKAETKPKEPSGSDKRNRILMHMMPNKYFQIKLSLAMNIPNLTHMKEYFVYIGFLSQYDSFKNEQFTKNGRLFHKR